MKSFIMTVALGLILQSPTTFAAPAVSCFKPAQLSNVKVQVGWFQRQEYTVSKVCIEGNYKNQGFNPVQLKLYTVMPRTNQPGAVVSYKASLERYSETQARFTIADGEPEPTQWDATFILNELSTVEFTNNTMTQVVPTR